MPKHNTILFHFFLRESTVCKHQNKELQKGCGLSDNIHQWVEQKKWFIRKETRDKLETLAWFGIVAKSFK